MKKVLCFALALFCTPLFAANAVLYPLTGDKDHERMVELSNADDFYGYTSYNDATRDSPPYAEGNQLLTYLPSGGSSTCIGFTQAILVPTHCTLSITRVSANPNPPQQLAFSVNGGTLIQMGAGTSITLLSGSNTVGWNSTTGGAVILQVNHSCTN